MPYYCYSTDCGRQTERFYRMGEAPESFKHEGLTYTRDIQAEWSGRRNTGCANWPQVSDAMGVSHTQVKEAMADAAAMGVPTDFNSEGQAIFTSARHRKAYCEAYGYYDRNGGYSDPQRTGKVHREQYEDMGDV
jgi:hypothetical protein